MTEGLWIALITASGAIVVAIIGLWARSASNRTPAQPTTGEASPTGLRAMTLNGRWTGNEGEILDFDANITSDGGKLTGRIRWTLVKFPPSWSWSKKPGDWGYEFVEGSIDKENVTLIGKKVDDPELLAPGTIYTITLLSDRGAFEGTSRDKKATSGKLSGTIRERT